MFKLGGLISENEQFDNLQDIHKIELLSIAMQDKDELISKSHRLSLISKE